MFLPTPAGTPMGAQIDSAGITFRVWAPTAEAVHVALPASDGTSLVGWSPTPANRLVRDDQGFWSGFLAIPGDRRHYRFWTKGPAGEGYKRDPRARQLSLE